MSLTSEAHTNQTEMPQAKTERSKTMIAQNSEKSSEKSIVKFDRSKRSWQVINGKTASFGAGRHNKRRALRHALRHDHPALFTAVVHFCAIYHIAEEEDQLMDRLLKAASILCKGLAYSNGAVQSQSDEYQVYTTSVDHETLFASCTCQDWQNGAMRQTGAFDIRWGGAQLTGGQVACKHILAQVLAKRLGLELPTEQIPF